MQDPDKIAMSSSTFEERAGEIAATFSTLTIEQQNHVMKELFKRCNPLQLRMLLADLGPVMSVDFVEYLPQDITEMIFSWLDVRSLCRVACCSRLWRKRANSDNIWKAMCGGKGWLKFGTNKALSQPTSAPPLSPRNSKTSITFFESSELLLCPPTCHWKDVYKRACQLEINWNNGHYTVLPLLRGHKKRVLALDCDGVFLVSGSSDNSVRVWDLETHKCSHVLENHSDEVTCVKIKAGLVVSGSADGLVRVFNALTGRLFGELKGHRNSVDCLAFDGNTILSGSADRSVRVWNVHTGKCVNVLNGHNDEVKCIHMVGSLAVSCSWDSTLRVWDLTTGICRHKLVGHSEGVYCCQFDEECVVSGGADASIRIWDTGSGEMKHVLTGHKAEIYCLQYDSTVIASGSADSTVRVWNHQGVCLHILREHIGIVRCLHLNGSRMITGGDQKKIVVWNAQCGKLCNVVHRQPTLLHVMWVDDTRLITASPDSPGTVTVISYW